MSQNCSPDAVFTPSPVTLVGAFVFGRAGVVAFLGAVWANRANEASIAKQTRITCWRIGAPGASMKAQEPHTIQTGIVVVRATPGRSHQFQPAHPWAAG